MRCFCGRPAGEGGLCPYHDPGCVRDPACRRQLVFTADCEGCSLPGGEAVEVAPRLRGARIYGPLVVEFVVGDVDLRGARGVDLFVYSVRGDIYLEGARFRHIYIDQAAGGVYFSGGVAYSFFAASVEGRISARGARVGGHVVVVDSSGALDLSGASAAGEVAVDGFRGDVAAGARAYAVSLSRVRGDVDLSGGRVEGDVAVVESSGGRLDLSGLEVGGRVFVLGSRFGGVRVDRAEVLRRLVVL
ncbi:hypothetical protein [Pyrobaculum neutrophilum]|uniref:Adhesin domain-containing protein n=1 Tax=Pyrobaculum neutrophilum (strain DSM 2338 / JCM 9278 / NBRC 100436 / V24Sta) TaxID=444157 RepID=B1YDM7_PYRNV|nr:hypothetical protein [Pyrobaculum neutrophilum]ACB39890.1 conserved hypothetical protein [Pyrobaculum neutrophilum V24Sta]